jgi:hypothetical protein
MLVRVSGKWMLDSASVEEKAGEIASVEEKAGGIASVEEKAGGIASVEEKDTAKEEKKKSKKISMYDVTPENDTTKFKGIFSYRHFRIAGWVCMAMTVASIMIGWGMKLSPRVTEKYSGVHEVLSFFAELGVFLFLFANFAVIIDKKSSYKKLFIMYGALAGGFVLLFADVYYRFLGGIIGSINDVIGTTIGTSDLMSGGFKAFNIFLDMLLCTAVIFFIDYRRPSIISRGRIHFTS